MTTAVQKAVLNPREVAAEYGIPFNTLRNYRHRKTGPRYLKVGDGLGRIRYRRADIEEWLNAQVIDPEAQR